MSDAEWSALRERLRTYLRARVHGDDLDDAVQDTLLQWLTRSRRVSAGYVFGIARHVAAKAWRVR